MTDVDLAVNFKSGEESLVKRNFITAEKTTSSVDAGSAWNEKFRIYVEQVLHVIFCVQLYNRFWFYCGFRVIMSWFLVYLLTKCS